MQTKKTTNKIETRHERAKKITRTALQTDTIKELGAQLGLRRTAINNRLTRARSVKEANAMIDRMNKSLHRTTQALWVPDDANEFDLEEESREERLLNRLGVIEHGKIALVVLGMTLVVTSFVMGWVLG